VCVSTGRIQPLYLAASTFLGGEPEQKFGLAPNDAPVVAVRGTLPTGSARERVGGIRNINLKQNMNSKQKTQTETPTPTETSVRAMAKRRGLQLQKGRSAAARYYGPSMQYRVVDASTNFVVFGGHTNGYAHSLDECADFIRNWA
jgi:hypothetical protein